MTAHSLSRRVVAEFVGTALLLAAVVGSGIMAETLADGNRALALLANALATGGALVALILTFGPISGGHFNPVVSFADSTQGGISGRDAAAYTAAQVIGALSGVWCAHAMFGVRLFELSQHERSGFAQGFSDHDSGTVFQPIRLPRSVQIRRAIVSAGVRRVPVGLPRGATVMQRNSRR